MQNQLNNLRGFYLTRDAGGAKPLPDFNRESLQRTMEVRSFDEGKRTVELAFSSEIEVKRWWGVEILDHDPASVDLSRLLNGGAVLVNHDWDDQVGVVESATIDSDRRGRAVVRFGRSEKASEVFQDIVDGIRRHVSVGYRIIDAKLSETRDEGDTDVYRITRWEPYEISIVSVPADPTVGVGRSSEKPQEEPSLASKQTAHTVKPAAAVNNRSKEPNMEKILRDGAGNLVRALVDEAGNITQVLEVLERAGADVDTARRQAQQAEQKRTAEILAMGEKYKCDDLARKAVMDGTTVDAFRQICLDHINNAGAGRSAATGVGGQRGATPLAEMPSAEIGLTDREVRNYSIFRAVRAMVNPNDRAAQEAAAFERECSLAVERQFGRTAQGILVPEDVLARAFNAGGAANTPAGSQTGNVLVDTEFMGGAFIDQLRNRTTIMRLGTTMGSLVGNVDIPRQTGGATAYWLGEGEDAQEGTPSLGQIELSPKTVAAYTDITRRLMMQNSISAESIVRNDLTNAVAQAIDYAGYYGSGTANQPRGIKNYTGINAVDFAALNPTFAELVQMETEISADNADIGQMGYVGNARFRGHCKTATKFGSGTETVIWEPGNTVNGYRTEITNQLINGDVFFGNFADVIIGMWGGLDLTVDPFTLSKSGGIRLVIFKDVDFVLRRVESICWGSQLVNP